MHINGKELISSSFRTATIEGRINYRKIQPGKSKANFKEYWFKLTGNLLFYFSLNSFGGIKGNEPVGVMVLENTTVSYDEEGDGIFAFIITFAGDSERHVFSCFSVSQAQNWIIALRQASYEHLRIQVKILESKLESLGGKSILGSSRNKEVSLSLPPPTAPSPCVPPRSKSVGPKSTTFVSHMDTKQMAPHLPDKNANIQDPEDLIKW